MFAEQQMPAFLPFELAKTSSNAGGACPRGSGSGRSTGRLATTGAGPADAWPRSAPAAGRRHDRPRSPPPTRRATVRTRRNPLREQRCRSARRARPRTACGSDAGDRRPRRTPWDRPRSPLKVLDERLEAKEPGACERVPRDVTALHHDRLGALRHHCDGPLARLAQYRPGATVQVLGAPDPIREDRAHDTYDRTYPLRRYR